MEFSNLFSGVDNLFKFLFIGGLVMLFTSMFYPLQKKQELDLEINNHNKEIRLLNRELKDLSEEVNKLNKSSNATLKNLKTLQKSHTENKVKDAIVTSKINQIKLDFKSDYDILNKRKMTSEVKQIILDFNKSKIKLLQKYAESYESYASKLTFWGITFIVFGLIGWIISTINSERLKIKEINRP